MTVELISKLKRRMALKATLTVYTTFTIFVFVGQLLFKFLVTVQQHPSGVGVYALF